MKNIDQISGRHHAVLIHKPENKSHPITPVLWLFDETNPRVFQPLLDYFADNQDKSLGWKRRSARAIGLFFDFCSVYEFNDSNSVRNVHSAACKAFIRAVQRGTINKDGVDKTGLFWAPMSPKVVCELARHLDHFVDGILHNLSDLRDDHPLKQLARSFSSKPRNDGELVRFLVGARRRHEKCFLRHLKNDDKEAAKLRRSSRESLGLEKLASGQRTVKRMNPQLIVRLLEVGFVKNESAENLFDREDVTAKMIFLLLMGAGLRLSEPLQLWFNDVVYLTFGEEERCVPMLRHPDQAETFLVGETGTRRQFLDRLGLPPRKEAAEKSLRAYWKNLDLDPSTNQTEAFFFHSSLEELFSSYYNAYLDYRRRLVGMRVARGECPHPFLFVAKGEDHSSGQSCIGNPYSYSAFERAWERALRRIEARFVEPIPRGKKFGTTPHALRHAYAQTLVNAGIVPQAIKKAMHHRHIESQRVYTEPEWEMVNAALSKAKTEFQALSPNPN